MLFFIPESRRRPVLHLDLAAQAIFRKMHSVTVSNVLSDSKTPGNAKVSYNALVVCVEYVCVRVCVCVFLGGCGILAFCQVKDSIRIVVWRNPAHQHENFEISG